MLAQIVAFFGAVLAKVLSTILQTPAIEEKTDVVEGKAKPVNEYNGMYGTYRVYGGGEGTKDSTDGESSTHP